MWRWFSVFAALIISRREKANSTGSVFHVERIFNWTFYLPDNPYLHFIHTEWERNVIRFHQRFVAYFKHVLLCDRERVLCLSEIRRTPFWYEPKKPCKNSKLNNPNFHHEKKYPLNYAGYLVCKSVLNHPFAHICFKCAMAMDENRRTFFSLYIYMKGGP